MKQILINYLSPLNRPQEDINHYIVELADDSLNGTHIEGYQTNEPIVKYCVQSAVERQAAFEHVISIRSDFVKGGECLIEKEKLDNNAYLEELWEYVEKDENGDEIIAYKQQDEDLIACYTIRHNKYYEQSFEKACRKADIEVPSINYIHTPNRPSDRDVRDMIVKVGSELDKCVLGKYEDCRLVLDCTGGDRSTAVMMIALTKMLEGKGFKDISLLGVNFFAGSTRENRCPIRKKTEISDIFDLITGTRQFLDYGDAKTLMAFFDKINIGEEDRKILESIQNFSDALTLCAVDNIANKLGHMVNMINRKRKKTASDDDSILLFEFLMKEIREDIGKLGEKENRTDLNIIKWCLKKKMIQQAVALFAERIPIAMVEQCIIYYPKDDSWDRIDQMVTAWTPTGRVRLPIYKNDLHNKLVYKDFSREKLGSRNYNLQNSPYREEMNFFNLFLQFKNAVTLEGVEMCPRKNWKNNPDIQLGINYREGRNYETLVQNVLNYMVFKADVRNMIMHSNTRAGKIGSLLPASIVLNDRSIKDMTINPDSIAALMYDLIGQLERLGLK